jgi:hypothetical protein
VSAPSTIIIDVVLLFFVLFEVDTRRTGLAGGAATLLSSHAGHPRPATSDTTKGSQAPRADSLKESQLAAVGTLSTSSDVTDHRIETASLEAEASARLSHTDRLSV